MADCARTSGVLKWLRAAGCVTLLLMAAISLPAQDDAELPLGAARSEYEIKSAILYNFTKFVQWPGRALGETGVPAVVGVLGDDGLVPVLEAALRNKTVYGHPIVVRRLYSSAGAKSCAVLFVGVSDRSEIFRIVRSVGAAPVLTIGQCVQFTRLGGVSALIRESGRYQFQINREAAERAGLKVSSKLLRLATVVRAAPERARN